MLLSFTHIKEGLKQFSRENIKFSIDKYNGGRDTMIVDPCALRQSKFWIINESENVGSITLGLVKINVRVKT